MKTKVIINIRLENADNYRQPYSLQCQGLIDVNNISKTACFIFALAVAVCPQILGQQILFECSYLSPLEFDAGDAPKGIVAKDLNGDQIVDLVIGNVVSDDVSVITGNGDGTFNTPVNYEMGEATYAVVVEDFNADSILDIVSSNIEADTISLRPGIGDGTYDQRTDFSTGAKPKAMAAGDIDGDGDLDIVTANEDGNNVTLLKNDGAGAFDAPVSLANLTRARAVAIADLDGDHDLDIVAANNPSANFQGTLMIFINNGSGEFEHTSEVIGQRLFHISPGDLDNDGDLDLVVSDFSAGQVLIMINDGLANFQKMAEFTGGSLVSSTALVDLDSDGDLDLASASGGSNAIVLRVNQGAAQFELRTIYLDAGQAPVMVAIADVENDGDPDIVATCSADDRFGVFRYDESLLLADLNLDGQINLLDVDPFVQRLADNEYQCEGDLNGDNNLNLLDVGLFVAALVGK